MNVPCKDCPNKGCGVYHDICTEYQEYTRALAKAKAENKGERDARSFIVERVMDTIQIMRKFKG